MDFQHVPFRFVPINVRRQLAQLLDVKCKVFASDWTNLGAEVGLTFVGKMLLEDNRNRHESNTMALFEEWSKNSQITVGKILDALEKINRPHEVRILNEAKNEILACFHNRGDTYSISQYSDRIPYSSNSSVDFQSETTSLNVPFYLNSYERMSDPSNDVSEERNSRQDTASYADSRIGSSILSSSRNDSITSNKNYNQPNNTILKVLNCGADKTKESTRVFITYGNGNKVHETRIYHLCKFLEKYFYCNVDLKSKRLNRDTVDKYFERAHFVLVCIDPNYKNSINQLGPNEEENPQEVHAAYIFSKITEEIIKKGFKHRFIPVLLEGASENNIPLLLEQKPYKWPKQNNELVSFLSGSWKTICNNNA